MNRRILLIGLALACIAALAAPASAYYNPRLGRFIQRDPTGYPDGMNAYEYCSGTPVVAADPEGLWKIKRSGNVRATATAEEGDTIRSLAKAVGLGPYEFLQWGGWRSLVMADGTRYGEWFWFPLDLRLDDEVCPSQKVTFPNRVLVVVGDINWVGYAWMSRWALKVHNAFETRGFAVDWLDHNLLPTSSIDIMNEVDRNLWGFALFGHGYGRKDNNFRRGSFVVDSNWHGRPDDILESGLMKRVGQTAFEYGGIIAYMCYADLGGWEDLVSPNGAYRGTAGLTAIVGGPRALRPRHWGSWDSLVEGMVNKKGN